MIAQSKRYYGALHTKIDMWLILYVSKSLRKLIFLDYIGINAKNKDINAIDELQSDKTGNRLNSSISYCEYIHKRGKEHIEL